VCDPLVLVVPRGHLLADPAEPVDLRKLGQTSRWMAAPAGEPSRRAVDRLLTAADGARSMPWEFEGLGTILSLVSRGSGWPAQAAAGSRIATLAASDGSGTGQPSCRSMAMCAAMASIMSLSVSWRVAPAADSGPRTVPDQASRSMGQLMQRGPPRPRPSSLPGTATTSTPFSRR